jgi:di/tricarboxylate transporter
VYWSQWFIAYLPLDIINILAVWWLMLRLYPPETRDLPGGKPFLRKQLEGLGSWSAREKRAAFWTLLAVGIWATDFLHHVSPAIVGLGVGLAATLPRIGVLTSDDTKKVNFLIVIFMGTTLSMAGALRETQALQVIADYTFRFLSPLIDSVMHSTVVLYWSAFVAHILLASETAMIAVSMPLIMDFALSRNLDPLALGMVWTFAVGGKIFIYQSIVVIAGYSFGSFDARDVLKVGGFLVVAESILLFLLVPLYWPLIGIG